MSLCILIITTVKRSAGRHLEVGPGFFGERRLGRELRGEAGTSFPEGWSRRSLLIFVCKRFVPSLSAPWSSSCSSLSSLPLTFPPCPLPQQERWALSPAMPKCWGWCKENFINQMRSREAPSTLSLTTMTEPWTQTWLVSSRQVSVQGRAGQACGGEGRGQRSICSALLSCSPCFAPKSLKWESMV